MDPRPKGRPVVGPITMTNGYTADPDRMRSRLSRPGDLTNTSSAPVQVSQPGMGIPRSSHMHPHTAQPPSRAAGRGSNSFHTPSRQSATISHHFPKASPRPRGHSFGPYMSGDNRLSVVSESEDVSSELSATTQATSVPESDGMGSKLSDKKIIRVRPGIRRGAFQTARQPRSLGRSSRISNPHARRTLHIEVQAAPPPRQHDPPLQPKPQMVAPLRLPVQTIVSDPQGSAMPPSSELKAEIERAFRHQIDQLRRETQSLQEKQSTSARDLEKALRQLSSLHGGIKAVEKERDQERGWRENLRHELDERSKMVDELGSRLSERGRILDEIHNKMAKQIQALEETERDRDALKKERDDLKGEKDELVEKCDGLEKDLSIRQQVRTEQEEVLFERVAALELVKEALENQIDALGSEKATMKLEMGDIASERDRLASESENQQSNLKSLGEEKEALEAAKQAAETEIQTLKAEVDALGLEKTAKEAEIGTLTCERDALKAKTDSQTADLDKVREDATTAHAELGKVREENAALQAEVDALKSAPGGPEHVEQLEKERSDLEKERSDLQRRTEELAEDVDRVNAAKEEVEKDMTQVRETLSGQLRTTNQQLEDVTAAHQEAVTEMSNLHMQLDKLASKSRNASRKRSRVRQEDFVVVRNTGDRGSVQVVKKAERRRSRSSSTHHSKDDD